MQIAFERSLMAAGRYIDRITRYVTGTALSAPEPIMDDIRDSMTTHTGFHPLLFPLNLATEIEVMLSTAIICVLLAIAAACYQPYIRKAEIVQVVGGAGFTEFQRDMLLYRAIEGQWPQDDAEALKYSWIDAYGAHRSDRVQKAAIDEGAIHFELKTNRQHQVLTIRPAYPRENPLGPVIWVVGGNPSRGDWMLAGNNRTTVEIRHIPRPLR